MSIKLIVEKYCGNCDEFEPEVKREIVKEMYTGDAFDFIPKMKVEREIDTKVLCKHARRCESMFKTLKEFKEATDGSK